MQSHRHELTAALCFCSITWAEKYKNLINVGNFDLGFGSNRPEMLCSIFAMFREKAAGMLISQQLLTSNTSE